MTRARGLMWALCGALPVIAADQVIKGLVSRMYLAGESPILVPGCLTLSYSENPAAAFGLFGNLGSTAIIALIIVVLGVFVALAWPFLHTRAGVLMSALVLGGAVGNLADRIARHYVIDYLLIPIQIKIGQRSLMWPVFNLADVCVVIGVGLLVILLFRGECRPAPAEPTTQPAPPGGIA